MSLKIQGVLPALVTPRKPDGAVDLEGLEREINFVYERGAIGIVLTGGTGEYFDLTLDQRATLLEHAKTVNAGRGTLIVANGAGAISDSVELAEHAVGVGVDALLLPPPHFYRYDQQDLDGFFREAAAKIDAPILIYNLASFTTPLEPATIVRLIEDVPNLVGVKDSSGNLDSLRALRDVDCLRILGHDRVYVEGLREGLLDAVISGPASVLPEASVAIWSDPSGEKAALFDEALDRVDALPYPWALKAIGELREVFAMTPPFSPNTTRQAQLDDLKSWLPGWLERLGA